jgi:hypothetical protein
VSYEMLTSPVRTLKRREDIADSLPVMEVEGREKGNKIQV